MSRFEGKVSGFVPRSESGVFRKRQTLVWDFRLERYDANGKPLPRVAVQMRAKFYRTPIAVPRAPITPHPSSSFMGTYVRK